MKLYCYQLVFFDDKFGLIESVGRPKVFTDYDKYVESRDTETIKESPYVELYDWEDEVTLQ